MAFKVTMRKQEVVAASLPLQEHWLPLSNLDLLLPPVDVGVFFCYKSHTCSPSVVSARFAALREALGQALVAFYAFSGEVVTNSLGEPEILCNNRGVDFVEVFAEVELEVLDLYNPDESIEGKFFPNKKQGVLAVQATELKCGGMVVACSFDHRVADAYSTNMFLTSWAKIANSKTPITNLPSFRRSSLNPRRPGHVHPSLNDMYIPVTSLPPPTKTDPTNHDEDDHLISRIYHVKAENLIELQTLASSIGCKRSKLESFCAFLWKIVALSDTSNEFQPERVCKMGIVVDGRARLSDENDMEYYFGNVLSFPFGAKLVQELNDESIEFVADEVHEFMQCALTKEHFLGLIDWVEAHRPVPGLAKIFCSGKEEGPSFVVSSGQRFPVSEVDFGWGKPVFGSYHFPRGGRGGRGRNTGYVMPMASPAGNGDWIVYMHMLRGQLKKVEKEGCHVFKPFTFDHLV